MINSSYFTRIGACVTVLTALGLASCKSSSSTSTSSVAQTLTVVSENDNQSKLLTEIYAQSLEKGGFRVARRDPVADLAAGYAALKSGVANLFITHTGDLLRYLAANEPAAASTSTTSASTTTLPGQTTTSNTSSNTATDNSLHSLISRTSADTTTSTTTKSASTATPTTTTALPDVTINSSDIPSGATSTTGLGSTGTTGPTPGRASATAINLQSNQIGEILPSTLQIGAASDAEDKPVIACTGAASTTGSLKTLSDVARAADVLRLAGPASFKTDTPFGLPGFQKVYGNVTFKEFIPLDPAKVGGAITAPTTTVNTSVSTTIAPTTTAAPTTTLVGPTPEQPTTTTTIPASEMAAADCGAFNSLDVTMPANAVEMDDDKNWIPNNGVIPVLTKTAYTPGVSQLVDQISQALTTPTLRAMLSAMAKNSVSPETMASRYIASTSSSGA
jgi:glycine betaine/choline ABC-type transport system substrate-binding protein